jgi:hypothetical protein
MLEFSGNSKFYEVEDCGRMDKVKEVLKSRLINIDTVKNMMVIK